MRLHYFMAAWDMNLTGVGKKVSDQIDALNAIGVDARLHILKGSSENGPLPRLPKRYDLMEYDQPAGDSLLVKISQESRRNKVLRKAIKALDRDDVVYMRYININHIPRKKRCFVVIEHQTKELEEYRLGKSMRNRVSVIIESLFGRSFRNRADGRVAVTSEIMRYEAGRASRTVPSIVVPNGINVGTIPPRSSFPHDPKVFRIIGLANVAPWHGYDRIIDAMQRYDGDVKVEFIIAGSISTDTALQGLCQEKGMTDRVRFIGTIDNDTFCEMASSFDLAVGAMAPQRVGLSEICSLKHREYCAIGIPFVYSGEDPDFPSEFPFAIRGEMEGRIDLGSIIEKVRTIETDADHIAKMRNYAEANLDWSIKMKKLTSWLSDVVPSE